VDSLTVVSSTVPPPPSDPATPSELGPGTPNSTTTSLSALSVVAIKDGSIGHGGRGGNSSANTLEAERADRISRLAGLERVAGSRPTAYGHLAPGSGGFYGQGFDNVPQLKERSTVGSASATGSVGGRTTWASGSVDYDADKMSEDQDDGVSSTGGFSDEDKASLVGFGEGAGSTVSGPVSTPYNTRASVSRTSTNVNAPSTPRTGTMPGSGSGQSTPMSGITPSAAAGSTDPRMMDGMSYDQDVVDTTMHPAPPIDQGTDGSRFSGFGTEAAEGIMQGRLNNGGRPQPRMGNADGQTLGKFPFERE
jgi:hypothetical protein